jgi:hypothetical protein
MVWTILVRNPLKYWDDYSPQQDLWATKFMYGVVGAFCRAFYCYSGVLQMA